VANDQAKGESAALLLGIVVGGITTLMWWRRSPTGPSTNRRPPAEPPAAAGNDTAKDELRASQAQAKAGWAAAAVALAALLASLVTLFGQYKINNQQIDLNQRAATRDDQVYASRVAVWYEDGLDSTSRKRAGLDVWVQNRAPAPVNNVRVIAPITTTGGATGNAEVALGALPPCTATTLRVAAPTGTRFTRDTTSIAQEVRLQLAFDETNRRWFLDGGLLQLIDEDNAGLVPAYGTLSQMLAYEIKKTAVPDCGEGS
jgi:hypothetical protein